VGVPPPGSITDLVADAHKIGYSAFTERMAREWNRRGLLGSPKRVSLGRGHGQALAVYSAEQRAVFRATVRNRLDGIRYEVLAGLPVWAWLNWGEDYVSNEQLVRALRTAVGPIPRKTRGGAERSASLLIRGVEVNGAPTQAVGRLKRELVSLVVQGPTRPTVRSLEAAVRSVLEPRGVAIVRGPTHAPLMTETVTGVLVCRMKGMRRLSSVTEVELRTAQTRFQETWPEYRGAARHLAAQAGQELAHLYDSPELIPVDEAVNTLLLHIGLLPRAATVSESG
jgi:hypothetical protein